MFLVLRNIDVAANLEFEAGILTAMKREDNKNSRTSGTIAGASAAPAKHHGGEKR